MLNLMHLDLFMLWLIVIYMGYGKIKQRLNWIRVGSYPLDSQERAVFARFFD